METSEIVNIFVAVEGRPFGEKTNFQKVSQCRKTERGTLWGFSTSVLSQNIKKLKGGKNIIFGKNLNAEKNERGTLWDFPTSILSKNSKKIEGGPFGEKIVQKESLEVSKNNWKGPFGLAQVCLAVPNKIERDPLVSPGMVCYARKQEKSFWFSSLGHTVQFGAICCNNIL